MRVFSKLTVENTEKTMAKAVKTFEAKEKRPGIALLRSAPQFGGGENEGRRYQHPQKLFL